jgi:dTDP-D-glucose 4,6-dehydratase
MTPTALVTGVTGQDGSYLAEFLLDQGYRVVGMTRRSSTASGERIAHLAGRIELIQGDLLDQASLVSALVDTQPREVYNLAAQSFVPTSWKQPVLTGEFTAIGVTRVLEAIRHLGKDRIKFYQASSSEIFAGAIRDHHRGTLVGQRSYGKGSVQGIFPLTLANSGVRLTTAKFYSPSGQPISNVGVQPDLLVRQVAKPADGLVSLGSDADDPVIAAGVQAARQQMAQRR